MSLSASPALAPCGIPLELDPLALAPPEGLLLEPLEDVDVVVEGDFDPDAGGELPQPATTRATVTSAAPIQVWVEPMSLLRMLRPPSIFGHAAAKSMAVGVHDDAARRRLLPRTRRGRSARWRRPKG